MWLGALSEPIIILKFPSYRIRIISSARIDVGNKNVCKVPRVPRSWQGVGGLGTLLGAVVGGMKGTSEGEAPQGQQQQGTRTTLKPSGTRERGADQLLGP